MLKKLFSQKGVKVWTIVTSIVLVLAIVSNVLILTVFNTFFNFALGGPKAVYADGTIAMYEAENSTSKSEAFANANEMNIRLMEEGAVLLKNEDAALPLDKKAKISVSGKNSVNLSYGNSGSSGGSLPKHDYFSVPALAYHFLCPIFRTFIRFSLKYIS